MKEFALPLEDRIAASIQAEAMQLGLTDIELLRYAIGQFVNRGIPRAGAPPFQIPALDFSGAFGGFGHALNQMTAATLKAKARAGALKCTNCTMPLTVEDIDAGRCHSCNAPIDVEGMA